LADMQKVVNVPHQSCQIIYSTIICTESRTFSGLKVSLFYDRLIY
jgi:hypothetical protein